jgi:signal peptidase I
MAARKRGRARAPRPVPPPVASATRYSRTIAEWTVTIVLLVFANAVLVQAFIIPTSSMENSLLIGDHLLVDKLTYAPAGPVSKYLLPHREVKRGDIIVFRFPEDITQDYVKRVIGVPGDHIRLVNKQVILNGRPLDEPYVVHKTAYMDSYRDQFPNEPNVALGARARDMLENHVRNGELIVPAGNYFAMGDNRDNSLDSRYWGFVPRENIKGKPVIVFWSYDAPTEHLGTFLSFDHLVDLAGHFFTKTRWNRTFKLVRGYPLR